MLDGTKCMLATRSVPLDPFSSFFLSKLGINWFGAASKRPNRLSFQLIQSSDGDTLVDGKVSNYPYWYYIRYTWRYLEIKLTNVVCGKHHES